MTIRKSRVVTGSDGNTELESFGPIANLRTAYGFNCNGGNETCIRNSMELLSAVCVIKLHPTCRNTYESAHALADREWSNNERYNAIEYHLCPEERNGHRHDFRSRCVAMSHVTHMFLESLTLNFKFLCPHLVPDIYELGAKWERPQSRVSCLPFRSFFRIIFPK